MASEPLHCTNSLGAYWWVEEKANSAQGCFDTLCCGGWVIPCQEPIEGETLWHHIVVGWPSNFETNEGNVNSDVGGQIGERRDAQYP